MPIVKNAQHIRADRRGVLEEGIRLAGFKDKLGLVFDGGSRGSHCIAADLQGIPGGDNPLSAGDPLVFRHIEMDVALGYLWWNSLFLPAWLQFFKTVADREIVGVAALRRQIGRRRGQLKSSPLPSRVRL